MANGWDGPTPIAVDDGAGTVYELGQDVTVNDDVTITHVRVWHPPTSNTVTDRAARFWTTGGSEIQAVPLSDALPSGWTQYALPVPLERTAGQQFVISYSTRQYYGALNGQLPNSSADNAITYTGGRFRGGAELFPNFTSTWFYGVDFVYDLGLASNTPPVASVSVQVSGLAVTAFVSVIDESPGTVTYSIEWGDGQTTFTAGPTAMHTYASPGTYAVMVTATDAQGAQDSASVPVTIVRPAGGSPFITWPDAEIALLDYLRWAMPGLVCDVDIPESYRVDDGVFVAIRRVGGQPNFPVSDYPMFDIEAYGPTRDEASDALGLVLAHLAVARRMPPVTGVFGRLSVITGPQYVEDTTTKEPRWQSLVSLPLRGKRVP